LPPRLPPRLRLRYTSLNNSECREATMAGFTVSRTYTMPREEVRSHAEDLAGQLESQYGITARWQGDTVTMRGNGVDGRLEIDDETVRVNVSLGLMARMFESPIRRVINEYLDRYIS
jgi:putative polyhydroxyalkanoate system protein